MVTVRMDGRSVDVPAREAVELVAAGRATFAHIEAAVRSADEDAAIRSKRGRGGLA